MKPLVLAFDLGTQSVRAMLVDSEGSILHFVQHKYEKPYYSLRAGYAEASASQYLDAVCSVSLKVKERAGQDFDRVAAVVSTTIRDTMVLTDEKGNALRDVILWLDKRKAGEPSFPPLSGALFNVAGMSGIANAQYQASACNYLMTKESDTFNRAHKVLLLSAFINYHMTGVFADSNASVVGHIPFDSKKRQWMKKGDIRRCIFDIPEEKLFTLVEPMSTIGYITEEFSKRSGVKQGLPLIATGTDKGCETVGVACVSESTAALSFGTTATIEVCSPRYFEPEKTAPAYPAILHGRYNPEVSIFRGFWMIEWFKREFAKEEVARAKELGCTAEELLNKKLFSVPAGCEGLVLQPYFTPGVLKPNAMGAAVGFNDNHTRAHLYRAIVEGIGLALYDGMMSLQRRGRLRVNQIRVAGGGSVSDEICQITADIFGLPVSRTQTHEAAGIGASMVAFTALGEFDRLESAAEKMVKLSRTFTPDMQTHSFYNGLYKQVYCRLYKKLEPLYKKIRRLNGGRNEKV